MFRCLLLLTAPMAIAVSASAADDVVCFDFETGDLQGWMVVEERFDRLVSDRDVFHNTYPERPDPKDNKEFNLEALKTGVKRGSVKMLRVVESPEKRHWSPGAWFGQGYTAPGMNWHSLENKRILGTVPVEEDGSAFFRVPAETFVYFQLLDAGGMMIQSMRSGASVHAGEVGSCVGCHDERRAAPPENRPAAQPLALRRGPSTIQPWYGPPREFSFMAKVQPVFTRQ